jgi:hypothetical protein
LDVQSFQAASPNTTLAEFLPRRFRVGWFSKESQEPVGPLQIQTPHLGGVILQFAWGKVAALDEVLSAAIRGPDPKINLFWTRCSAVWHLVPYLKVSQAWTHKQEFVNRNDETGLIKGLYGWLMLLGALAATGEDAKTVGDAANGGFDQLADRLGNQCMSHLSVWTRVLAGGGGPMVIEGGDEG